MPSPGGLSPAKGPVIFHRFSSGPAIHTKRSESCYLRVRRHVSASWRLPLFRAGWPARDPAPFRRAPAGPLSHAGPQLRRGMRRKTFQAFPQPFSSVSRIPHDRQLRLALRWMRASSMFSMMKVFPSSFFPIRSSTLLQKNVTEPPRVVLGRFEGVYPLCKTLLPMYNEFIKKRATSNLREVRTWASSGRSYWVLSLASSPS